ncbi:uncharacterized protein LOC119648688 isoform X1 [Hermetia illucens]|uniref:uncharacterized protein LOC119648688 isoform X1 n=1 Tax=Hermetia illucens TaxID=343691 RepID=UPI0018CC40C4|nr:uncharacterized protein LOC119648688 isoform X1 [Hermetia illucens]
MHYLQGIEISRLETEGEMEARDDTSKSSSLILVGIKVVELCLIVVCLGLIDDPANNSHNRIFISPRTVGISYATIGAFLIFTAVYIIMKIFSDSCPWKTSSLMSILAVILFIACGTMLLRDWSYVKERGFWPPNTQRLDLLLGAGAVSIVIAVVFLVDLGLTVLLGIKGDVE